MNIKVNLRLFFFLFVLYLTKKCEHLVAGLVHFEALELLSKESESKVCRCLSVCVCVLCCVLCVFVFTFVCVGLFSVYVCTLLLHLCVHVFTVCTCLRDGCELSSVNISIVQLSCITFMHNIMYPG